MERLQASHPDLRIELREGLEQQLLPALRAGELDCIVGRLVVEGADADLQCEILYEEATAAVCGPSHPLATRSRLGGAELDRYRWVLPSRNAALYSLVASAVAARGAGFPQVAVESGAILTIVSLLQRTPLLSAMPLRVARSLAARGQLAILPLALQAKLHPVGIMTRRQARAAPRPNFYRRCARRRKWCAMRRRSASGLRRRRRRADAAAVARPRPTGPFGAGGDQQLALGPAFLQPQGRQAPRPQPPLAGAQRQYADAQPGGDHLAHGVEAAHLDAQAQRQAGVLRRAREGVQQRAAPVQADEVIGQAAPEIGDVARGQRMVRRRHHHQPVAAKGIRSRPRPHAGGADAQVGQAVLHRSRDVAAQLFLDLHARAGAARHEVGQRRRQELHQRGHIGPQPHMTARAAGVFAEFVAEEFKALEQARRVLQRQAAGGGQDHARALRSSSCAPAAASKSDRRRLAADRARWQWRAP